MVESCLGDSGGWWTQTSEEVIGIVQEREKGSWTGVVEVRWREVDRCESCLGGEINRMW